MAKKKNEPILSNKDSRFRSSLLAVLRKFSKWWEPAKNVKEKARIARGMYQCQSCSKVVGPKEIKIDHIDPVIPVTGFVDWNDVVERLFCEESGLQAICIECHSVKTEEENKQRRRWKKEKAVISYYKEKNEKKEE
jgi:5-methylcytosine-specific restriction endonuclease McrA